jgi:hypothetical protein
MTYRTSSARLFVCRQCHGASEGPSHGGQAVCSRCRAPNFLVDRSRILVPVGVMPIANDPGRLQHLRVQDGRPRIPPPTLQAVLGGTSIQPGREQEVLFIWQSLRSRSENGDVAASEDLSMLTLMLANQPGVKAQPGMVQALSESALDAVVLPRHKQEHMGRLARLALASGDVSRGDLFLAAMHSQPAELDADSEYRISQAVRATVANDFGQVLTLLGPQKDAIPIADSLDGLASVFRANAIERMGNVAGAAQILKELPDPKVLDLVRGSYPQLELCKQSGSSYTAGANKEAAARAAMSAGGVGLLMGVIFILTGVGLSIGGVAALASGSFSDAMPLLPIGGVLFGVGLFVGLRARSKGKRAAYLRIHGVALEARVVSCARTGTEINNVPVMILTLQVMGQAGPYAATIKKLMPDFQAAQLMGHTLRVRAAPDNPQELILEE